MCIYYVSGFVGYVLLAHYIRTYVKWSTKKIFSICIPVFVILYAVCFFSANYYSTRCSTPAELERDWQNLTIIAVAMSFAAFMLISTIKSSGKFYNNVILMISGASYGMYLMHMLILPHYFRLFNPLMTEYFTIPLTVIATYLTTFIITSALSKLPFGKYLVG